MKVEINLEFDTKPYHNEELAMKVFANISEYTGFSIDEILNYTDYAFPFGGAVRDSIAGSEIHNFKSS